MEKIRLQKYFTDCGIMSRRAAEKEILSGNVTVNGQTAVLGDKIEPETDKVSWNGNPVLPSENNRTYIMLNKPMGYVTTMSDEKGRHSASELVADVGRRVYPVGRLDMYSEGLLIFTDDGELANDLTHPSKGFEKKYLVKIKGIVEESDIAALASPMELDGYKLKPVEVESVKCGATDKAGNTYSSLLITLHEGRNRQIRRMCEKCGLTVMRLKRIALGEIKLGKLESGKWRYLTNTETEYLKKGNK